MTSEFKNRPSVTLEDRIKAVTMRKQGKTLETIGSELNRAISLIGEIIIKRIIDGNKTTGMVVKPILSHDLNRRAQMDLIDMQTLPDGEYKWLMVYQDHFTKFLQLRPLRAKIAIEVASALIDVFSILGVPYLLQSDNGREFRNQILFSFKSMWPD
ncbi:unnamed protein product [Brachionus calyciflorus]|uniref:Integrase catalytic domain-containing protein n=1 Tax=Brachionus calyciflorus TaxID=104777 RepID=A0A814PHJ6_9BILA|nr:unnamed protein product [Brachionus calyciflorus]